MQPEAYRNDLAYIHDAGFGMFGEQAASHLVNELKSAQHRAGLITELGCGSGTTAVRFVEAGFQVHGVDISPAMIELARRRTPSGRFQVSSFVDAVLQPSIAVTAIGEVFCYLFDERTELQTLEQVFGRIYAALLPGGLLLFDVSAPGRAGATRETKGFRLEEDWACLSWAREDTDRRVLTREITTFRKVDGLYSRDYEVHRLRLYDPNDTQTALSNIGFQTRTLSGYADFKFPPGLVGFLCRKPSPGVSTR